VGLGGGIYLEGASLDVTLANSILASNSGGNCQGTLKDFGHDISFPDATCPGSAVDPKLGALQSNGGPTATEAIAAGSPAQDAVPTTGAGCEPTDQRGVARPQGPGCDTGAFELAPPSATTTVATGLGTTFATLQGSAFNPDVLGGSMFFQWGTTTAYGSQTPAQPLASGSSAPQFSAALANLVPGLTYHFRAVASNPDGTAVGVDRTLTTLTATVTKPPPTLSSVSLTNKRFRIARKDTAISAKRIPRGTTFRFTLSAAANVQITITRSASGLRRGRRCIAPTSALRRAHAKRCTRTLTVATLTRSHMPPGASRVPFSGRIGHRPLIPRAYNAVLTASNSDGRSKPVTLAFVVVR
jgi:hypothetical protein